MAPPEGPSLEETAERFDALYTRLTVLQRRLVAAIRSGADDDLTTRELIADARTILAACETAERAARLAGYPTAEVEARAMRARVLTPPIDGNMVMAAARGMTRGYGFPLLADALELTADPDARAGVWRERTVVDVLAAPRAVGMFTGRAVAAHARVDPQAPVSKLGADAYARLIGALRECADELPQAANGHRRRTKLPDDGTGAGRDLLHRWIDASGTGTTPARQAAREAAARDGWPADAVPTARLLTQFTQDVLMPQLIPNFALLVADGDHERRSAALRAEERSYREAWQVLGEGAERSEAFRLYWVLKLFIEASQALAKAEQLDALPSERWRSGSPLSNARTVARRCGEILSAFDEDSVDLLAQLPAGRSTAAI